MVEEKSRLYFKRGLEGVFSDADGNGIHPRINDKRISDLEKNIFKADKDAFYSKELSIDLSTIEPYVSGPNTVKTMTSVSDLKKKDVKIDKAYLVSCVNSRLDDIKEAAAMVRGKKLLMELNFMLLLHQVKYRRKRESR